MHLVSAVKWRPLSEASKDSQGMLVFVPRNAHVLQTRGLHIMRWSGWGGGVWEDVHSGWKPLESEMADAVWTELEPIAAAAKAASI